MKNHTLKATIAVALLSPLSAFATNGYWATGYGTKSKSIAGACVAMRFDAMCAATNPGSLAFVGNHIEAGLALFAPERGFTANPDMQIPQGPNDPTFISPGKYESGNDIFFIPHFAYNHMLDAQSSLGIAIGANGGMNTEYSGHTPAPFSFPAIFSTFNPSMNPQMAGIPGIEQYDATSPTGIDMMQLFIGVTYSRKLNDKHALGITPILAVQSMKVQGLEPFKLFSLHPDNVTGKGRDISYGGGVRIGWSGEVLDQLVLGASYQTKMWMSQFDKYKGLFAEEGGFDIPPTMDLGFAYQLAPKWTLAFGYQRIFYSEIKSLHNPSNIAFTPNLMNPEMAAMLGIPTTRPGLGGDNSLGFGWHDMNVIKFGLQWEYSPTWTLRAGYSHASAPYDSDQALFNILAPATIQDHYTFGFTHTLKNDHEINLAVTHAANAKIHGQNPNTGLQTGYHEMNQWEIELSWSKHF